MLRVLEQAAPRPLELDPAWRLAVFRAQPAAAEEVLRRSRPLVVPSHREGQNTLRVIERPPRAQNRRSPTSESRRAFVRM